MQSDDVSVRYTIFGGILTQLQFIPEVASGPTGVASQLGSMLTRAFFSLSRSALMFSSSPGVTGLQLPKTTGLDLGFYYGPHGSMALDLVLPYMQP